MSHMLVCHGSASDNPKSRMCVFQQRQVAFFDTLRQERDMAGFSDVLIGLVANPTNSLNEFLRVLSAAD